jgi:hypothetical protein
MAEARQGKPRYRTVGERVEASAEKRGDPIPEKGPRRRRGGGLVPTDAELLFRLRVVEAALLDGKRSGGVMEALKDEGRVVPLSTVNGYILRIRDRWEMEDAMVRPMRRERQTRKLHDVAEKLEALGAWGHWIAVQKLIADLEGNLAPVKVEHKQVDQFEDWSLVELREYIDSDGEVIPPRLVADSARRSERGTNNVKSLPSKELQAREERTVEAQGEAQAEA